MVLTKYQGLVVCLFVFYYKLLIQQFLPRHYLLHAAGQAQALSWGASGRPAFAVLLVDRLPEQHTHLRALERKRDIMSWIRQMPIFIFGIISWMWRDEGFFSFPYRMEDRT